MKEWPSIGYIKHASQNQRKEPGKSASEVNTISHKEGNFSSFKCFQVHSTNSINLVVLTSYSFNLLRSSPLDMSTWVRGFCRCCQIWCYKSRSKMIVRKSEIAMMTKLMTLLCTIKPISDQVIRTAPACVDVQTSHNTPVNLKLKYK